MRTAILSALGATVALAALNPAYAASLREAADRLGATKVDAIEFAGGGLWYQFGQAPNPTASWPPFEVSRYVAQIDYNHAASRVQITRKQVVEAGRVRPAPVEQRVDQYVNGAHAWSLPTAGTTPAPQAQPGAVEERAAEIWATPQGFVKAALAHHAKVRNRGKGIEVSFSPDGKHRYVGFINAGNEVENVRTWIDSPVLGDTLVESRYSGYRDFGDIVFPARIERSQGGFPVLDITVAEAGAKPPLTLTTPPAALDYKTPPVTLTPLADGVYYLTGGTHHSVAVEQDKRIVLIEAPLNEERSNALLAKLKETFPDKPVTHLVNSHAHFDHLGGVRTLVAAGATIVTHGDNEAYYKKIWSAPHTLTPDRLAGNKNRPHFQTVTDKFVLNDARHPVEIHAIVGSGHENAFLLAWLPNEKILVEGDAYTPAAADAPLPKVANPYNVNLYDNIRRLNLPVERIAALHGPRVVTLDDLRAAIGGAVAQAKPEDLIKVRQAAFRVIGWHCGRVKANLDGQYNKDEVIASAAVIQSIANAELGNLFVPGTEKGIGFHESRLTGEAFSQAGSGRLAEVVTNFRRDANELIKVATSSEKEAVKASFGNLTKSCKSCHDDFRLKQ